MRRESQEEYWDMKDKNSKLLTVDLEEVKERATAGMFCRIDSGVANMMADEILENRKFPENLPEMAERYEDMSPDGRLRLHLQEDGDVLVCICKPDVTLGESPYHFVEFCAPGAGGGQSPHTRKALLDLMAAIQKDNEENPIGGK